jgi:two-component system alkaline phosphatase synthesis response regulator PhoP
MAAREPRSAPTVLVADDDPDLVALMARRLERAGYDLLTARDGAEAAQLAAEHIPDVAVLDVMMPKLTGIEVAQGLKADPSTNHIGVVLVSAGFHDAVAGEGAFVDADDFIRKPFGPKDLPAAVGAVLDRARRAA